MFTYYKIDLHKLNATSLGCLVHHEVILDDALVLSTSQSNLIELLIFLKNLEYYKFNLLVDIVSFDNLYLGDNRFSLAYVLTSGEVGATRIIVYAEASEGFFFPTVSTIFSSANWAEREVWEMHGVYFAGHSELRRLLTESGFKGHPLRKDFPMAGYIEYFYNDYAKQIEKTKVEFVQEFRVFNLFSENWSPASYGKSVYLNKAAFNAS